jgi:hypothetical protein
MEHSMTANAWKAQNFYLNLLPNSTKIPNNPKKAYQTLIMWYNMERTLFESKAFSYH